MAGGGGYGDALERDPALVLDDVIEGKVTRVHAAEAYGVVIADGPAPCLNVTATAALRARLRRTRS
jgi:N-methylhydantoinase B